MTRRLLILLLFVFARSAAQDPYHITIDKSKGIPSNSVYNLFQDSKGFIWMAHDEGLSCYDGFEFRNFGNEVQGSKAGTDIREDKFGRIWYSNFDGYLYYVTDGRIHSMKQNKPIGYVRYAIIDDRLMVMQRKGLDIYDLSTLKLLKTVAVDAATLGSIAASDHFVCMATNGSVHSMDKNGNLSTIPFELTGFMYPSGKGVVNITRENELGYFLYYEGGNEFRKIHTSAKKFIQGYSYSDSTHWLCTTNGLWAYDSNGIALNMDKPFYPGSNITCVLVDREKNYWISTLNEGVFFIPDIHTRLLKSGFMANGFLKQQNQILITSRKGTIYNCGMGGSVEPVYTDAAEHPIYKLIKREDQPGYILLTKDMQFLNASFERTGSIASANKDIRQIDKKYCAFAGTGSSGLLKLRDDVESPWDMLYEKATKTNIANSRNLFDWSRGRLVEWISEDETIYYGLNTGLFRVTPSRTEEVTLDGKKIVPASMAAWHSTLLAVSMQNKLLIIEKGKQARVALKGDEQPEIYKIRNLEGNLLLVTNTGIRSFDPTTGKLGRTFTTSIPGEEINDIIAIGSILLVATDKGLFYSESTDPFIVRPELSIQSLTANGVAYSADSNSCFSHKENDIEIRYSILSFKTGGYYPLYYSINDSKWQLAGDKSRSLKLASLAPGKYKISFRFENDDRRKTIRFDISKPFWMRWWFLLLVGIIVLSGGIFYYYWRTGLLKKRNSLLLEKAELEKSLHRSMLTSIKSQMNPHFFYNALNTIQSYIFSDDKRNATTYLSKFSKLTRTILEMSERETVTLAEEIAALGLYLDLEKARFNDALNYTINTSAGLDIDSIRLPSMIIQPYVENSIKHGLLHQKGEKELRISFDVKDNNLCVVIDDNGIGRKKSEELNKARTDKYRSFATEANLKRIEILNRGKENIGVKYIDKVNELGQPTGTTLIITIPLVKESKHVH